MNTNPYFLSAEEAMKLLGLSIDTLLAFIKKNNITYYSNKNDFGEILEIDTIATETLLKTRKVSDPIFYLNIKLIGKYFWAASCGLDPEIAKLGHFRSCLNEDEQIQFKSNKFTELHVGDLFLFWPDIQSICKKLEAKEYARLKSKIIKTKYFKISRVSDFCLVNLTDTDQTFEISSEVADILLFIAQQSEKSNVSDVPYSVLRATFPTFFERGFEKRLFGTKSGMLIEAEIILKNSNLRTLRMKRDLIR